MRIPITFQMTSFMPSSGQSFTAFRDHCAKLTPGHVSQGLRRLRAGGLLPDVDDLVQQPA